MDIHYNAFISYRHHPDDIRVASQIHRLLEHYRVPRAIRLQSKGITRLFRDKEELPITSNLSDDINRALENSDFLIVICSTHTRESTWVQREIQTFLKTHDRSRVLTVLVDGDPYDTIPEILLHEERVDPETGETEMVEFEPLSCDWRMPLRQAKREELPRLAAALLGCGYDELRRRERQYRARRRVAVLSAALTAALGFSAYVMYNSMRIQEANNQLEMANSQLETANSQLADANTSLENANAEIQANLNEALINQSQFLASTADKLREEGDRMTAMLLALEALPEYEGERPYVAEAEYSLTTAVGAYQSGTSLVAAGSFSCGELVESFLVTEDGNTIYILDARNVVSVWNTRTFEKLASITLRSDVKQMLITLDGSLLIRCTDSLLACYSQDGTLCWSAEGEWTDMAFLGDRGTVILGEMIYSLTEKNYSFHILDAQTGTPQRDALYFEVAHTPRFLREVYAANAPLVLAVSDYPSHALLTLDLEKGTLEDLSDGYAYIYTCAATNDGNLLALVQKEMLSGTQGIYMDMTITTPEVLQLQCYSPGGKLLWETEMTTYSYSILTTLERIPQSNDILCQTGNLFLMVDGVTGAIKASSESIGYVLWTEVGPQYTRAVLESGSTGSFRYDSSQCGFIPSTKDNLICVDVWEGDFYVVDQLGTQVTVYRYIGDENWVSMGTDGFVYPNEWQACGDYLALESYSKLQLVNTAEGTVPWELSSGSPELIGFSPEGTALWVCCNHGESLLKVDIAASTVEEHTLPAEVEIISPYSEEMTAATVSIDQEDMVIRDGFAYYMATCYLDDQKYLFRCDIATGEYTYWAVYGWDSSYSDFSYGRLMGVSGDFALIWNQVDNTLLEFHMQTGQSRVIASDILYLPAFCDIADGKYLAGTADAIQLRSWNGDAELNVNLTDCRAISLRIHGDSILALSDDGHLYRFDMSGNQLSRSMVTRYNTFANRVNNTDFDPACITWDLTADGNLILGIDGAGNLIDCETWKCRAWLPQYCTYVAGSNRVLLRDPANSYGLGTFPLYSTEDIMAMAREALNGSELTEDQRASYGLD